MLSIEIRQVNNGYIISEKDGKPHDERRVWVAKEISNLAELVECLAKEHKRDFK